MTPKESNNEWSDGIAAHPAPKIPSGKIRWKISRLNFLGSRRHPPIVYLPKGQTINAEYYSFLPVELKDILMRKLLGNFTKVFLFLHDNAPALRALATHKKLAYLSLHFLDHQHFSPDLAPSNYHLFPGLKNN